MLRKDFLEAALKGGPGLNGYAFNADTFCIECAQDIIRKLPATTYGRLQGTDDPAFGDSDVVPQPIFFGECPERKVYCFTCREYLYGEDPEKPFDELLEEVAERIEEKPELEKVLLEYFKDAIEEQYVKEPPVGSLFAQSPEEVREAFSLCIVHEIAYFKGRECPKGGHV